MADLKLASIGDVFQYLTSIAIGIRFRSNFSIEDHLGTIIDRILYEPDSFFGPEFFPESKTSLNEKALVNPLTGNYLRVNPQNVILEYTLPSSGDTQSITKIVQAYEKQLLSGVLKEYYITQIARIGIIHRYNFDISQLAKSFLNQSIGKTLDGVNDLSIRFSKRYPMEAALAKRGINDYRNVIYNIIKEADKDNLLIALDYQWYFDPPLEKATGFSFQKFIDSARSYNSNAFPEWINKNYGALSQ